MPDGIRIYAIGDIHGRDDLLARLHATIKADAATGSERNVIIYLGDYVDRGITSKEVVERLVGGADLPGFETTFLIGNHEAVMLDFLNRREEGLQWLAFGGLSTIYSYGVKIGEDAGPDALRAAFDDALPRNHRHFFKHLKLSVTVGDYYFVHAGVRGGIPLNRQSEHDQLWIRDVFLNATGDFGKIVVHGHTPTSDPVIRSNRIGIDTGAYATGKLTALVLEGANRRFLTT